MALSPVPTQIAASKSAEMDNVSQDSVQRSAAQPPVTKSFAWGAGIECSFIPHLNVDQFEWTQHNRFWHPHAALRSSVA